MGFVGFRNQNVCVCHIDREREREREFFLSAIQLVTTGERVLVVGCYLGGGMWKFLVVGYWSFFYGFWRERSVICPATNLLVAYNPHKKKLT